MNERGGEAGGGGDGKKNWKMAVVLGWSTSVRKVLIEPSSL